MQWLEISVDTTHERLEPLAAQLEDLGVEGLITEDETDVSDFLEGNRQYWDYVDEDFLKSVQGVCRIKFYLEDSEVGKAELARIAAALPEEAFSAKTVRDEDWENNWREYYKPIPVGERLMIVPQWQEAPDTGRVSLRLDPGLIFGTGAHATTQLCLAEIEHYAAPGASVLDMGCGSGILAIAALLLCADRATGVDIDDKAPGVVMENAGFNAIGPDRLTVFAGDVLSDSALSRRLMGEKFDLVLANIVADVIIALSPKVPDFLTDAGTFICSGIIEGRENEVEAALKEAGFMIAGHREKDGWHAFICKKGDQQTC